MGNVNCVATKEGPNLKRLSIVNELDFDLALDMSFVCSEHSKCDKRHRGFVASSGKFLVAPQVENLPAGHDCELVFSNREMTSHLLLPDIRVRFVGTVPARVAAAVAQAFPAYRAAPIPDFRVTIRFWNGRVEGNFDPPALFHRMFQALPDAHNSRLSICYNNNALRSVLNLPVLGSLPIDVEVGRGAAVMVENVASNLNAVATHAGAAAQAAVENSINAALRAAEGATDRFHAIACRVLALGGIFGVLIIWAVALSPSIAGAALSLVILLMAMLLLFYGPRV